MRTALKRNLNINRKLGKFLLLPEISLATLLRSPAPGCSVQASPGTALTSIRSGGSACIQCE